MSGNAQTFRDEMTGLAIILIGLVMVHLGLVIDISDTVMIEGAGTMALGGIVVSTTGAILFIMPSIRSVLGGGEASD